MVEWLSHPALAITDPFVRPSRAPSTIFGFPPRQGLRGGWRQFSFLFGWLNDSFSLIDVCVFPIGAGLLSHSWTQDGRLPGPGRERDRDRRPPARERPDDGHVLCLRRIAVDRAALRTGPLSSQAIPSGTSSSTDSLSSRERARSSSSTWIESPIRAGSESLNIRSATSGTN